MTVKYIADKQVEVFSGNLHPTAFNNNMPGVVCIDDIVDAEFAEVA